MQHAGRMIAGGMTLLAFGLAACDDDNEALTPQDPQQTTQERVQDRSANWAWNHMYGGHLELAREIPTYGGLFYRGDTAIVYVTDRSNARVAQDVVGSGGKKSVRAAPAAVEVKQAKYELMDLLEWTEALSQRMGERDDINGVAFYAKRNRVLLGLAAGASRGAMERVIEDLGIPLDAVIIETVSPIINDIRPQPRELREDRDGNDGLTLQEPTLQDYTNEIRGGYQVTPDLDPYQGTCTFSILANTDEWGYVGVAPSHCTTSDATTGNTGLYQPTLEPATNFVLREVYTHPPFTGEVCGPGDLCKWADMSLFSVENLSRFGGGTTFGQIQTTAPEQGSIVTNPAWVLTIDVPGDRGFRAPPGTPLIKYGHGSVPGGGRRDGEIEIECLHVNAPSGIQYRCEQLATYSAGADSGAPVISPTQAPRILYGFHHGGVTIGGDTFAAFSPWTDFLSEKYPAPHGTDFCIRYTPERPACP